MLTMTERTIPLLCEIVDTPRVETLHEQYELYRNGTSMEGKFVRIGQVVLLAPHTLCRRSEKDSIPDYVLHVDIALAGRRHKDSAIALAVRQSVLDTSLPSEDQPDVIDRKFGISDAGYFFFVPNISQLQMTGQSSRFGQALPEGRDRTLNATQSALGGEITVIGDR